MSVATPVRVQPRDDSASRVTPACRHCGAALPDARTRESGFCCAGCAYVHRLVHEHGLDGYYRLKDNLTAPADPAVFQPRDFSWLTTAQRVAEQAATPGVPELTLDLQGISCAGCVWLIERLFQQTPGARDIIVNAQLGQMRLRWLPAEFDAAAFARKLHAFNYVVGPANADTAEPESRSLIRRIGLCTAFAMNVMLFTLPVYFGMEQSFAYARLFGTLSMAFGTLSVLAGGGYFLGRAWLGLRAGAVSIDLPIALGLTGAYLGSLYGWLTHDEAFVYFDFVSAFILLMLVGRWAQVAAVERNRRRLLRAQPRPGRVTVTGENGNDERDVESLRTGDRFELRPGQVVPVAARLESATATLGTAWISGEADPRDYPAGAQLPAGAVNLSRTTLQLRATQPWADSLLAELLQPAQRDAFRHQFLERIITGYLVGIIAIATLAGIGWWLGSHDLARTWSVVTAVLVVSCPCAIGLAFPLVDEIATIALRRAGLFVRQGDLWPRVSRIRRIVFDKTGTLTFESPQLQNPNALAALPPDAQAALFALVRDNQHPVSQSLCETLLATGPAPTALTGELRETPGCGVSLVTPHDTWALGRPGWSSLPTPAAGPELAAHDTEFTHNGRILARFHFADSPRPGARTEIDALRALGHDVFILSGDRSDKVRAMAATLGVPSANAFGGCSPQAKADWLKTTDRQNTLMLGDGANDSLAFDAAFARGTPAIHRGVLETKADFYYLGRGLASLRQLFALDAIRRRTHRWLLVFSLTYNALAVGLAVSGHMSPLLAAILMPLSSLATLAIVAAGMRGALTTRL